MTEGRQREAWNHTSSVLATLVNINRDPKKSEPASPSDFNPFTKDEPEELELVEIDALKMFVDQETK